MRGIGSGLLCPVTFTGAYVGPSILAYRLGGLPLVCGMTVFAGFVEAACAPFLRRLRRLFPAEMAGLVVLLVGIVIGSLAVRDIGQLFAAGSDERIWTAIAVTFGTMTVLAVWGRQLLSLLAVLGGILAGIIYACVVGLLTPSALIGLTSDPIIAPPPIGRFGVGFDATLVLPFAVAAIATATKAAGVVGLALTAPNGKATQDRWTVSRGIFADGLTTAIAGFLGTTGLNTSPSSVAVVLATRVSNRRVAIAIGAILMLFSFSPPLSHALALLPRPIVAATMLFTGCLVLSNGLQMITARGLDNRKSLTVGMALFAALAVEAHAALFSGAPAWLDQFTGSSLVLGTTVAMTLNLLFRAGAWQRRTLTLQTTEFAGSAQKVGTLLAAPLALPAIEQPLRELIESISTTGRVTGPVKLVLRYDAYSARVHVSYQGSLPALVIERHEAVTAFVRRHGLDRLRGRVASNCRRKRTNATPVCAAAIST